MGFPLCNTTQGLERVIDADATAMFTSIYRAKAFNQAPTSLKEIDHGYTESR